MCSVDSTNRPTSAIVNKRAYEAFGAYSYEWDDLIYAQVEEDKGFIGERFDRSAELHYLNARFYDSDLKLFTSPDWFEVTMAGVGTNRFSYSFNDPVNLRDPSGNVVPLLLGRRGVCFFRSV